MATTGDRRILLIDNYDSYTWNLFQLLWQTSGICPTVIRNDDPHADSHVAEATTIVLSAGPGTPTEPKDFGVCEEVIRRAVVPCLGVCLGHQGIAHALGGEVELAPEVMHGRISLIHHDETRLFRGIPQDFRAVRYHSLRVNESLPADIVANAWAPDGSIMAITHRERPLFGVQFHPESIETEHGDKLMANFLEETAVPSIRLSTPVETRPDPAIDVAREVHWVELDSKESAADLIEVFAEASPFHFWLDSARVAYGMGRYSYLGAVDPGTVTLVTASVTGRGVEERTSAGNRLHSGTIFDFLQRELTDRRVPQGTSPVPFAGGFVGYLGYGVKLSTGTGRGSTGSVPDAEFMLVDRFLAIDHETDKRYLVAVGMPAVEAQAWFDQTKRDIAASKPCASAVPQPAPRDLTTSVSYDVYREHFTQIQEWLRRGDSYEACYTYQIRAMSDAEPLQIYLRLRDVSPAPYAAFLRFGDRRILSSSPERFVTVDGDRWAETKPIKGTAARLHDPLEDAQAKHDLATDEKNRSENLMIVDLLRNDLGRVCEVGTVHVPRLMEVESYATVHQLVTTIRGRLREEFDSVDCVEALFPGGSMTGAPKKRTVELLDDLEPEERGAYSGSLGFFSLDGRADMSIIIRTMVWENDRVTVGVGGAITAMSDVKGEYQETRLKARGMLRALGVPS